MSRRYKNNPSSKRYGLDILSDKYSFALDVDVDPDDMFWFAPDATAPNTYNGTKGFFQYIQNAKKVHIPDIVQGSTLLDYYQMFNVVNRSRLKVSNEPSNSVTNMASMFLSSGISFLDLSGLNTNNVISMESMFDSINQYNHVHIDLSNFDTSKVENMKYMFLFCYADILDLSNFDISAVKTMEFMFGYSHVKILDLSSFEFNWNDLPDVTDMFVNCHSEICYVKDEQTKTFFETQTGADLEDIAFSVVGAIS